MYVCKYTYVYMNKFMHINVCMYYVYMYVCMYATWCARSLSCWLTWPIVCRVLKWDWMTAKYSSNGRGSVHLKTCMYVIHIYIHRTWNIEPDYRGQVGTRVLSTENGANFVNQSTLQFLTIHNDIKPQLSHTYIHTYIHTYAYLNIHTYDNIREVAIYAYIHTYIYIHKFTYNNNYRAFYIHTYMPTYIHSSAE